jgi:hypothetical protein
MMSQAAPEQGFVRSFVWFTVPATLLVLTLLFVRQASLEGALVRFVNAMLTSFTLVSFVLLTTLFAYGDARKRPLAPLFGMVLMVGAGGLITYFFLAQGDLLMENNGSIRAQALSNIIRFGTTVLAMTMAMVVVGGTLLASLLNSPPKQLVFEEE